MDFPPFTSLGRRNGPAAAARVPQGQKFFRTSALPFLFAAELGLFISIYREIYGRTRTIGRTGWKSGVSQENRESWQVCNSRSVRHLRISRRLFCTLDVLSPTLDVESPASLGHRVISLHGQQIMYVLAEVVKMWPSKIMAHWCGNFMVASQPVLLLFAYYASFIGKFVWLLLLLQ